mgnify:FL=1
MAEKCLELKDIRKSFSKDEVVLKEISLSIDKGEFITLLGSSGCGKTTTLRIIAGLETPDSGKVYLEGKDVTALAPEARDVNTVFQNYALFPHMTVADNIGYGLKLKKIPKAEIKKRVSEMLELVQLPGYEKRKPSELSGGQKQRVAIARSLVNNPKVLLLDEPLGALDLQLRRAMQLELKRLQKKLGITFIYITHDQEEAINMSDRIAVMNKGTFEQIGTPDEIYNHPKTSYVATFVGNANILKGKVVEINGSYAQVQIGNDTVSVYTEEIVKVGEQLTLAVRSENILLDEAEMENVVEQNEAEGTGRLLHATVKEKNFAAGQLRVLLALSDGTEITASRFGMNANIQPGQQIKWYFDPRNAIVVDREFKTKEPADMSGGNQ